MKTRMLYVDEVTSNPLGRPLRYSGLGDALSHAARFLRLLFGGSASAGDPGTSSEGATALSLAAMSVRGPLAFEYPVFRPTYQARPAEEPDEVPDQPDPPPSTGSRLDREGDHLARLLLVLRNVFGGLPPGKGLTRWRG
jgi:hypothetical protein